MSTITITREITSAQLDALHKHFGIDETGAFIVADGAVQFDIFGEYEVETIVIHPDGATYWQKRGIDAEGWTAWKPYDKA